jgi:hypothetical protein
MTALKQRAPPEPAVTPLDGDVAPSTRTLATGAPTDTTPAAHTPNAPALVNPNLVDATANPVRVAPGNPNLAPVRFAHANTIPVAPVASSTPIVHGPCDFSGLRLGKENPWGSIRHRHHRSHPLHTYHRDSRPGPGPSQHLHAYPPHPHHLNSRPHHLSNAQPSDL